MTWEASPETSIRAIHNPWSQDAVCAAKDSCFLRNLLERYRAVTAFRRKMTFSKGLPHFAAGVVVKGFGRGSKELGIPTANFEPHIVKELPPEIETGIYFGWAQVDHGPVHKMVMSVGWNPYFKNVEKSMETHILGKFTQDFYGRNLRVCMAGYLRPETDFTSLDALVKQINADIAVAEKELEEPVYLKLKSHQFFNTDEDTTKN